MTPRKLLRRATDKESREWWAEIEKIAAGTPKLRNKPRKRTPVTKGKK